MIRQGTKEIQGVFQGNKEIQNVFQGNNEVWANLKAIDLGTNTSFNIRTLLPKVDYTQLTANNFFVISATGTTWYDGQDDGIYYNRMYFNKSYNASTGVLTCSFSVANKNPTGWCRVCFVNKPNKLVLFSNMKTRYSSKWQTFTSDNIITSSFSPTEELVGIGSPYSITANSYMTKTYDRNSGNLSAFKFIQHMQCSRVAPNVLHVEHNANGIYVIPKLIPLSEA